MFENVLIDSFQPSLERSITHGLIISNNRKFRIASPVNLFPALSHQEPKKMFSFNLCHAYCIPSQWGSIVKMTTTFHNASATFDWAQCFVLCIKIRAAFGYCEGNGIIHNYSESCESQSSDKL